MKKAEYVILDDIQIRLLMLDAKRDIDGAFDIIFRAFFPYISMMCEEHCPRGFEEDDIVQECSLGIWDAIREYSHDTKEAPTRLIKRRIWDRLFEFTSRGIDEVDLFFFGDKEDAPIYAEDWFYISDIANDIDYLRDIYEMAKTFPPEHRTALLLYINGWSLVEIGDFLGVSSVNVKVRYFDFLTERINARLSGREVIAISRLKNKR